MEKGKAAFNELIHKHIPELRSELQKVYQKQLDHDVGAMVETFVSTKEQMKKMVEQNATPMDLIEFMEQSCSAVNCRFQVDIARQKTGPVNEVISGRMRLFNLPL